MQIDIFDRKFNTIELNALLFEVHRRSTVFFTYSHSFGNGIMLNIDSSTLLPMSPEYNRFHYSYDKHAYGRFSEEELANPSFCILDLVIKDTGDDIECCIEYVEEDEFECIMLYIGELKFEIRMGLKEFDRLINNLDDCINNMHLLKHEYKRKRF